MVGPACLALHAGGDASNPCRAGDRLVLV